jgi:flagellar basal-body rod modification protein FlgD
MTTVNTNTPASPINDLMATMNPKKQEVDSVQADTDKFMTLLVTQLKNQDPLNPLDNAQVTSQLAQLSTVTGVNKLNATLETLKSSYQSTEALQATSLIERGVLVEGKDMVIGKGKAILGVELETPADKVVIEVFDAKTGKQVAEIDMGEQEEGVIPIAWDAIPDPEDVDAEGKPKVLPDGHYTFNVVATRGGEKLKDAKGLAFDSVASVTTNSKDGVKLNLAIAGMKTMADIKQVL